MPAPVPGVCCACPLGASEPCRCSPEISVCHVAGDHAATLSTPSDSQVRRALPKARPDKERCIHCQPGSQSCFARRARRRRISASRALRFLFSLGFS